MPSPLDLQSYNRYSYTRNNPLGRVDPSGFEDYGLGGASYDAPFTSSSGSYGTLGSGTYALGSNHGYGIGVDTTGFYTLSSSYSYTGSASWSNTDSGLLYALTGGERRSILDRGPPISMGEALGHGLYDGTVGTAKEIANQYRDVYELMRFGPNGEFRSAMSAYYKAGGSVAGYFAGMVTGPVEGAVDVLGNLLTGNLNPAAENAGMLVGGIALRQGAAKGPSIALGLGHVGGDANALGAFSKQVGGLNYHQWESAGLGRWDGPFAPFFNQATSKAGTIHFNLDGMDLSAALKAPIDFAMRNNVTNSELRTILNNQSLLDKTTFYRGGQVVPAPR